MKMTRWGVVFMMLGLAGCATMDIHTDFDNHADFSKLKTFAWLPDMKQQSEDPRIANEETDFRIRNAVEKVLAAKGYRKIETGQPDFWVAYQAAIKDKIDAMTANYPYNAPSMMNLRSGNFVQDLNWAYGGSQTFLSQYEEGTLILDIVNPKDRKLMWRGTAKAVLVKGGDSAKKEARLNDGVQKIFATFPPK